MGDLLGESWKGSVNNATSNVHCDGKGIIVYVQFSFDISKHYKL